MSQTNDELKAEVAALRSRVAELEELSLRDELTGLLNVRALRELGTKELASARRSGEAITVHYFDLDKFKPVNDTHGHAEGDQVLVDFADSLRDTFRRGSDFIFRIGGDEFLVLAHTRVYDKVANPAMMTFVSKYDVGFSYGTAMTSEFAPLAPLTAAIERAEGRMYASKGTAR